MSQEYSKSVQNIQNESRILKISQEYSKSVMNIQNQSMLRLNLFKYTN